MIQERGGMGIDAMTMTSCSMFLNPGCVHESDRSLIDLKFDPNRPSESGLAIVRAQRGMKTDGGAYAIGGWCQMTVVSQGHHHESVGSLARQSRSPDRVLDGMISARGE